MRIKVQFDDNDTVKVEDAVSLKVQDGIYIITKENGTIIRVPVLKTFIVYEFGDDE
jgi:hypothetical protein